MPRSGSKKRTGLHPLAYTGVEPITPAQFIQNTIDPTDQFHHFNVGTMWVNVLTDDIWVLTNLDGGDATWTPINHNQLTINGDVGAAVAVNDEIDLLGGDVIQTVAGGDTVTIGFTNATDGQIIIGDAAGDPDWGNILSAGGTIAVTEGANTINLDIAGGFLGAQVFHTDAGDATIIGNAITIAGGTNINTAGAGGTVTINVDDDIVVDGITIEDLHAGFLESDAAGLISNSEGTDGQIIIGATGAPGVWGNLTSAANTIEITEGANTLNVEVAAGVFVSPYVIQHGITPGGLTASSVAYYPTSDLFVLTTTLGGVYTTPDGENWTVRDAPGATITKNLHLGADNYFVGTANTGTLKVATDPTGAWTGYSLNNPGLNAWSITRHSQGNGYWLMVGVSNTGTDGTVYGTDPTAANFVENSTGITEVLSDCAYGNGVWVVVGENGFIATQDTDPTGAWTFRANPFSQNHMSTVFWCEELSAFFAGGGAGRIARSPDGINWTLVNSGLSTVLNKYPCQFMYDDGANMIICYSASQSYFVLSKDGNRWIDDVSTATVSNYALGRCAAGGGELMFVRAEISDIIWTTFPQTLRHV